MDGSTCWAPGEGAAAPRGPRKAATDPGRAEVAPTDPVMADEEAARDPVRAEGEVRGPGREAVAP
jgi:hypothetical protein